MNTVVIRREESPLAGPFLWAVVMVIACIGSFFIAV
jgi:hypothetical protein